MWVKMSTNMRSSATARFAYPVTRLDELEGDIATLLYAAIGKESIRTIIVAPRQRLIAAQGGWRRRLFRALPWRWTPAWVLVLTDERLLVATRTQPDAIPMLRSISPAALLAVEVGVVLLMGWMTCVWAEQGRAETLEVRFNTVSDSFFWEVQQWLCQAAAPTPSISPDRHLERLAGLPYRFRQRIPRRLLLPGEVIEAVLFQEAIWQRRFRFFRRRVTPSRVVLLTDAHVLVVSDEEAVAGGASHGVIARYFPRRHVRAVSVAKTTQGTLLTVSAAIASAETTCTVLLAQQPPGLLDNFLQMFHSLDNEGER